jgi:hypothetical protein
MRLKAPKIYDHRGRLVSPANKVRNDAPRTPTKNAFGLAGNLYSWQNAGKYRQRFYTLSDSNQGMDTLSRELLVRWSREMFWQLPIIRTAVRCLADFSIGEAYVPQYYGKNPAWWAEAGKWLTEEWMPSCNVRGTHYDFQKSLRLESQLIDTDGDYLLMFGTKGDLPRFQIIQNNRIKNLDIDNTVVKGGPMDGAIISDGVYYSMSGEVKGYCVQNAGNLVSNPTTETKQMIFSARDATLCLDPEFVDKLRGIPAIGSAILQALSVSELDQYLMEKIKIESSIGLIEKTPTGQAPYELQNTLSQLLNVGQETGLQGGNIPPNLHALQVVQGADIRYVYSAGGEIKTLASNSPANESQAYMERLETQVLSTITVPHQLVYSTDKTGGRITSSVAEIFRAGIRRRQSVMDKTARFRVCWALAKAMEMDLIPENEDEVLPRIIGFTKPPIFSLDAKYDSQIVLDQYQAGISTLDDASARLFNRRASDTIQQQAKEQIEFLTAAKKVSDETGIPIDTVIGGWRYTSKTFQLSTTPGKEGAES